MEQRTYINCQLEVLKELRQINPEIGIQTLSVFFLIAKEEGIGVMEIAEKLDISGASASRNVNLLSKDKKYGVKGFGLVVSDYDIHERRRKVVTLSPAGRALIKRFTEVYTSRERRKTG